MCNNQGIIALPKNLVHHARTKDIDVQHHFVREKVERRIIGSEYCPTELMVEDMLTKALAKDQHEKLIRTMESIDFGQLQSGSVER